MRCALTTHLQLCRYGQCRMEAIRSAELPPTTAEPPTTDKSPPDGYLSAPRLSGPLFEFRSVHLDLHLTVYLSGNAVTSRLARPPITQRQGDRSNRSDGVPNHLQKAQSGMWKCVV